MKFPLCYLNKQPQLKKNGIYSARITYQSCPFYGKIFDNQKLSTFSLNFFPLLEDEHLLFVLNTPNGCSLRDFKCDITGST